MHTLPVVILTKEFYTVVELSKISGYSTAAIYAKVRRGELRSYTRNEKKVFRADEITFLLRRKYPNNDIMLGAPQSIYL